LPGGNAGDWEAVGFHIGTGESVTPTTGEFQAQATADGLAIIMDDDRIPGTGIINSGDRKGETVNTKAWKVEFVNQKTGERAFVALGAVGKTDSAAMASFVNKVNEEAGATISADSVHNPTIGPSGYGDLSPLEIVAQYLRGDSSIPLENGSSSLVPENMFADIMACNIGNIRDKVLFNSEDTGKDLDQVGKMSLVQVAKKQSEITLEDMIMCTQAGGSSVFAPDSYNAVADAQEVAGEYNNNLNSAANTIQDGLYTQNRDKITAGMTEAEKYKYFWKSWGSAVGP
jgi:hypothetical protein